MARQLAAHCAFGGRQGACSNCGWIRRTIHPHAQQREKLPRIVHLRGEPLRLQIELAADAPVTAARERDREADARLANARATLEEDPNIKALRDRMGATIFAESIRPTRNEES